MIHAEEALLIISREGGGVRREELQAFYLILGTVFVIQSYMKELNGRKV